MRHNFRTFLTISRHKPSIHHTFRSGLEAVVIILTKVHNIANSRAVGHFLALCVVKIQQQKCWTTVRSFVNNCGTCGCHCWANALSLSFIRGKPDGALHQMQTSQPKRRHDMRSDFILVLDLPFLV